MSDNRYKREENYFKYFSSKSITQLLTLIEDKEKKMRKLSFLALVILLQSN